MIRCGRTATRATALVLGAACVLGLAACDGSKSPSAASSGPTSTGATSTGSASTGATSGSAAPTNGGGAATSPAPSSAPVTAAELGSRLAAATAKLTSAHLVFTISASGQNVTAVGDEKLSGGKLVALQLAEQVGSAKLSIVVIGTAVYVKLPSSLGSQKYVQATPGSKSAVIRQLSASLTSAEQSASLDTFGTFAKAASSVTTVGKATVGTTATTHYKLVVDVAKLPKNAADTALSKSGVTTLPVDLWLDDADRPVKVQEKIAIGGAPVATSIVISRFGAPVTITKPATG